MESEEDVKGLSLAQLRKLQEMLSGEAWKLLDMHYALQEQHQMRQALDPKMPSETRSIAVGAYNAIRAMREYPKALGLSLKRHAGLQEE